MVCRQQPWLRCPSGNQQTAKRRSKERATRKSALRVCKNPLGQRDHEHHHAAVTSGAWRSLVVLFGAFGSRLARHSEQVFREVCGLFCYEEAVFFHEYAEADERIFLRR